MNSLSRTPLSVLKLIANSDQALFEHHLRQEGLTIVGHYDNDPLRNSMQSESVYGLSTNITDDVNDPIELTTRQHQLRTLAEQSGYIVGVVEGLDQMPGTLPNPLKALLNADPEDEQPEAEEEAPPEAPPGGAEPPPV